MLTQLMFVVVNGVILNKVCVVWWYERDTICVCKSEHAQFTARDNRVFFFFIPFLVVGLK